MTSRNKGLLAVAVLALVVAGFAGGCNAHRRPPAPTPEERALLDAAPLPYSVAVAWWGPEHRTGQNADAYASKLADLVIASHTFRDARYEKTATPARADLVVTPTGVYCNTAVIPLLSIISLGVIPTIFNDEQCVGARIRSGAPGAAGDTIRIDVRFKGTVIMGWAAMIAGLLPGWAYGDAADDARFRDHFRLAVLARRAQLDSIAHAR